ncbi:MAG: NUDIX domain-containing protein [Marinibacterium sp.]
MSDLFVFGPLCHPPLLAVVLGRAADPRDLTPAWIPDHAARMPPGQPYPVVSPAPGHRAGGGWLTGLTTVEQDRLAYYAGATGQIMTEVTIEVRESRRTCRAILPMQDTAGDGPDWVPEDWAARWATTCLGAADEIMSQYGRLDAAEIAARRYPIRVRAAQLARAEGRTRRTDPTRSLDRDVIVHARHRPYLNFFSLEELDLQFRRHDGSLSPVVNRAALRVGDAAVVLPYDPQRDRVLLVEQFRPASFIAGDRSPWLWEAPAGLVDPGETPEAAAFREAEEEARLRLTRLEPVTEAYSTTGASTEYAYIYVGIADLSGGGSVAGLASEDEDIRSEVLTFADFMAGIAAGKYVNLHLVTAAYWLALNRDRLRAG